jgi:hypothetical protein
MEKIINIDWLSFFCQCGEPVNFDDYTLELKTYGTQIFEKAADVIKNNEVVAIVLWQPRSAILAQNSAMIKIKNRQLYNDNWYKIFTDLEAAWFCRNIKISRIDICADFVNFKNGLYPKTLISNFLTQKFVKVGRGNFKVIGEQKKYINYQYLRFGSGSSDISAYLYNKSTELKEVKDKPYIRELWHNLNNQNNRDVWRLEFSLKGKSLKIVDTINGNFVVDSFKSLTDKELIANIYSFMVKKYFQFVIPEQQKNKSRWKKLVLFDDEDCHFEIVDFALKSDTSRKHKIFLTNLVALEKEMRSLKSYALDTIKEVAQDYAEEHNLVDYIASKQQPPKHFD